MTQPHETPAHLREAITNAARLQEIFDLDLASAKPDPVLESMLEDAATRLDLPIALVSIVLDGIQYFAAMRGVEGWMAETRGTPIEWSFCTNVVVDQKPFLVRDAQQDPRVSENPLVWQENIRSYAGVPLRTSKGEVVGSFCVIGSETREFTQDDVSTLEVLAAQAMVAIEQRRSA